MSVLTQSYQCGTCFVCSILRELAVSNLGQPLFCLSITWSRYRNAYRDLWIMTIQVKVSRGSACTSFHYHHHHRIENINPLLSCFSGCVSEVVTPSYSANCCIQIPIFFFIILCAVYDVYTYGLTVVFVYLHINLLISIFQTCLKALNIQNTREAHSVECVSTNNLWAVCVALFL